MNDNPKLVLKNRTDVLEEKQKKDQEILEKELEKLSSCADELFTTETGQFFLKNIIKLCGVCETKSYLGADMLHFREGMKYVYTNGFKKLLNPITLAKLEKEVLNDRS
jgi:hypothetical protein